jgi:5-methylcytosine-specific restriction protein A
MAIRKWQLRRFPLCATCLEQGKTVVADEVDHILPIARGGGDDWDNLRSLCRECHLRLSIAQQGGKRRRGFGVDGLPLPEDC